MDTCGAVLSLRTNKNFVGRRFKRFGVNLDISPKKAKCVVSLFRNVIHVICAYPMIRLKRCQHQDILLRIQYATVNDLNLEGLNSMSHL